MSALELVDTLRKRGVTLSLEGGRIRYEPRSGVQGDDLERLKSYRDEVVKLLEPDPLSDAGWSGYWRERIQTRLQALEDWIRREEYGLMRVANNGLLVAQAQAREKLVRWYISMERGTVNLVIALGDSHSDLEKLQARLLAFDGVDSTLESSGSEYKWQLVSTQLAAVKAVSRGARALNLYGIAVGEHLYDGCVA